MSGIRDTSTMPEELEDNRWRSIYFSKKPVNMNITEEYRKVIKNAFTLELEIKSLTAIIAQRDEWLNEPNNRMRRTYEEVAQDTNILRKRLEHLKNRQQNLNQ